MSVSETVTNFLSDNKSKFEEISLKLDPHYKECLSAISVIKEFIQQRGLIIYGGTAIDYALRLKGDKIYPDEDLSIPDLDFYSPDSVKDAYDLADILYSTGYSEVRAIRATYVKTMRVDVGHQFLADITYMPQTLFNKLPFLKYEGMKIIHPNYQRIDLHIGLTYLYDSPPREAIFARWKFIKRLNILDKHYPLDNMTIEKKKTMHVIPYSYTKYVFAGIAAYSMMIKWVRIIESELGGRVTDAEIVKFCEKEWKNVYPVDIEITEDNINIESFDGVDFINFNIDAMADEIKLSDIEKFTDVGSFMPKRIYGLDKSNKQSPCGINIYSSAGKYVSVGSMEKAKLAKNNKLKSNSKLRFVGSQYLLSSLIAKWILTGDKIYVGIYNSVMSLIKISEKIVGNTILAGVSGNNAQENLTTKHQEDIEKYVTKNPMFISTAAYGNENMPETLIISLKQLEIELGVPGVQLPLTPVNYYPSRGGKRKNPDFVYEESEFFTKDGRRID